MESSGLFGPVMGLIYLFNYCFHIQLLLQNNTHINPLNAELNPVSHLLALLGTHHIFHVNGLRVKSQQKEQKRPDFGD